MYRTIRNLIPFILLMGLALPAAQAEMPQEMMIERTSPLDFDATIVALIKNAKGLGWKVPKKWKKNFQKNLKRTTKVDIGRNLVIEMCEPKAAAKLLIHDKYKKFLSMMPCAVAVYEKSDGKVYLSMMNIQLMAQMYKDEKEIQDMVNKLGPQMEQMLVIKKAPS